MAHNAQNGPSTPRNIESNAIGHEDIPNGLSGEIRRADVSFTVPGPPTPYTRVLKGSQQPRAMKYRAYRDLVGLRANLAGAEPFEGPVDVRVQIYVPKPDRRRFDIDNVLKGILDALNGVCYADDKQVTTASVSIYWDPEAEVRIRVARRPV